MSTSSKGKTPISTNDVETYSKETLGDEIRRLIAANAQLVADKIETEKVKVSLETDRMQLLSKKNSLVVKKEELRIEIIVLNTAGFSNILIRGHQDPFLRPT